MANTAGVPKRTLMKWLAAAHRGQCSAAAAALAAAGQLSEPVLRHRALPPATTRMISEHTNPQTSVGSVQGWRSMRTGPTCVPAVLRRLAAGSVVEAAHAANSGALAPAALARLAANENRDVQAAALVDSRCPVAALVNIHCDLAGFVQETVVLRDRLPPHLLERLSWSEHKSVRSLVGAHPDCPLHVLTELVEGGTSEERAGVAANPACLFDLFECLAWDDDEWVLDTLAENPSCPPDLLAVISARYDDIE